VCAALLRGAVHVEKPVIVNNVGPQHLYWFDSPEGIKPSVSDVTDVAAAYSGHQDASSGFGQIFLLLATE
jgi:hypothetical protein